MNAEVEPLAGANHYNPSGNPDFGEARRK